MKKINNNEIPLSILMLIDNPPPFAGGGAGKHAYKLAQALKHLGYKVKIICPKLHSLRSSVETYHDISTDKIGVPTASFNLIFSLIYNIRLALHLITQRAKYDIIHIQGIRAALSVLIVAKILRKNTALTILSKNYWDSISGKWSIYLIKQLRLKILTNACQYIVLNQHLRDTLINDRMAPAKISLIPNGTDFSEKIRDKSFMRQNLNLPPDSPIVMYAGRLHKQKNIPFLLRSWKRLNSQIPSIKLLILGEGPELSIIKKLIHENGLNKSVELLGYIGDVEAYMNAADIFILPSENEGCSNALLEAMSYGMACIATNSRGNDEIIKDGINGSLIEFDNDLALAEKIQGFLHDHELRQQMGLAARDTIRNKYSMEKIAQTNIQMYLNNTSINAK